MLIFKKFVVAMLFLDMLVEITEQFSCLATTFFFVSSKLLRAIYFWVFPKADATG